jgi:hypothetical protein
VRDPARDSSDRELKEKISETYDGILTLKERMLGMDDEVRVLKAQLAKKASITGPVAPYGYVFKDADMKHPLCPKCYQEKGHEYPLSTQSWDYGGQRRDCRNCRWFCIE